MKRGCTATPTLKTRTSAKAAFFVEAFGPRLFQEIFLAVGYTRLQSRFFSFINTAREPASRSLLRTLSSHNPRFEGVSGWRRSELATTRPSRTFEGDPVTIYGFDRKRRRHVGIFRGPVNVNDNDPRFGYCHVRSEC